MKTAKTVEEVRSFVKPFKDGNKSVGLVPTMGFLHEGHMSLIRRAREENECVVVSIFVNPTQFGPGEDLDSYPRDLERDLEKCEEAGVDLVFMPDPEEMYQNHKTYVQVEDLSRELCGKSRPIHFRGVCTVVTKLFNISKADRSYFGEKDIQQLAILKKMVKDLNMDIEVIGCPIVREADGLAMSSRNKYLSESERQDALCLSRAIEKAKSMIKIGMDSEEIITAMSEIIDAVPGTEIDYIQVVDSEFLQPVDKIEGPVTVALAVQVGPARLIDNFTFRGE